MGFGRVDEVPVEIERKSNNKKVTEWQLQAPN